MEDFQAKVGLVADILKSSLENFDLYIAVDSESKEFVFIDRAGYDKGIGKTARVSMEQVNVKY